MEDSDLLRHLREHLSSDDLATLRSLAAKPSSDDYRPVFDRAVKALPRLQDQVARNQERMEQAYANILDLPQSRLTVLIANSPPPMLAALTVALLRRSHEQRLTSPRVAARYAEVGLRASQQLRKTNYLGAEAQIDLEAEAWIYLANARRINSDLRGAETCFHKAQRRLRLGTGDRRLRALFFYLKACLRFRQGRVHQAAELFDRELKLRRRIGEPGAIGRALIDRGVVAAWAGPLEETLDLMREGAELVDNDDSLIISLHSIAERLARDGEALLAWKVVCNAETASKLLQNTKHALRLRWIKGITYRALGELVRAQRVLTTVREELLSTGQTHKSAIAALDLAAVAAAEGDQERVQQLAHEAYEAFRADCLDERAMAAFLVFHRAVEREQLTEELAVRVANYLAVQAHDRSLSFEAFTRQ